MVWEKIQNPNQLQVINRMRTKTEVSSTRAANVVVISFIGGALTCLAFGPIGILAGVMGAVAGLIESAKEDREDAARMNDSLPLDVIERAKAEGKKEIVYISKLDHGNPPPLLPFNTIKVKKKTTYFLDD